MRPREPVCVLPVLQPRGLEQVRGLWRELQPERPLEVWPLPTDRPAVALRGLPARSLHSLGLLGWNSCSHRGSEQSLVRKLLPGFVVGCA